jgi:hypothetical protein
MFPVDTLLTQSCVVDHREPGAADDYGDHPLAVVASSTYPCWFAQTTRRENPEGTAAVERERWALYLPADAVIDANDAVWVGDDEFEVHGEPWPVIDPVTTAVSHIETTLERRR